MRLGWVTETVGLREDCDGILISSFSLLCTIDAVSMRGRGGGGEGGGEEEREGERRRRGRHKR